MRIALVSHVARPSGAEIVLERLARELARENDVHAVFFESGPMVKRLEDAGATVHVVDIGRDLVDARRSSLRLPGMSAVRAIVKMRQRLVELRPDVVHSHSLKSGLITGVAARSAHVPFV
jgi:hypothetical protein